ncbi:hypothetical protein MTO96_026057 [Rhipicephalus appendiculatus]
MNEEVCRYKEDGTLAQAVKTSPYRALSLFPEGPSMKSGARAAHAQAHKEELATVSALCYGRYKERLRSVAPFQPASPIVFALGAHPGPETQGCHYPPPRQPGAQHLTAPHTWNRQIPYTTEEPRSNKTTSKQPQPSCRRALLPRAICKQQNRLMTIRSHQHHTYLRNVWTVWTKAWRRATSLSLSERATAPLPPSALCPPRALRAAQRSQSRRSLPQPLAAREGLPTKFPSPLPPQTTRGPLRVLRVHTLPPQPHEYHTLPLHNRTAARERDQSAADYVRRTPSPSCNLLSWRNQGSGGLPTQPGNAPPSLQPQQKSCPHRERQVLASSSQNRRARAQGREYSPSHSTPPSEAPFRVSSWARWL